MSGLRPVSIVSSHTLPRLGTATCESVKQLDLAKEYQSGANYHGKLVGNQKSGYGIFTWPNGAMYEGEFVDNVRTGKGKQKWEDGSTYEGEFINDMRHGTGQHSWANEECYKGEFFRDRRHGTGLYEWPDGSSYSGTFYIDRREGFGTFTFSNGTKYEGLYKADEREGPGVLTYPDGTQDVGLWHREKLVKLCQNYEGAFSILDHKQFNVSLDESKPMLDAIQTQNQKDVIDPIINPPDLLSYEPEVDLGDRPNTIFSETLHIGSVAMDLELFHNKFFNKTLDTGEDKENNNSSKLEDAETSYQHKAWNMTPSLISMQRHILKHKEAQKDVGFNIEGVMKGNREGFMPAGHLEQLSVELIDACSQGDLQRVIDLLDNTQVHVDVADKSGYTPLLAAAVNWHKDVINALLDRGADVNKLNDEGVSALAACHVYFYPPERFKYNIAELDLEKPDDFEQEKMYDVQEALRGFASTPTTKKRPGNDKKGGIFDPRRINKLRQEYSGTNLVAISEAASSKPASPAKQQKVIGTLNVKRVAKTNVDEVLAIGEAPNYEQWYYEGAEHDDSLNSDYDSDGAESHSVLSDFESTRSVRNLPIEVSDQLIERCATQLSTNEMVVDRKRSSLAQRSLVGTVRRLAVDKSNHLLMQSTIRLLLQRGADPNASKVPMPVLFFAIKAADVEAVKILLMKGASTSTKLSDQKGGLAPLHIACALPGEEGVQITELLLSALADPDVRATEDETFLNKNLQEEWKRDKISESSKALLGGRCPLHIACARDDNYQNACKVVHLLLDHHANHALLCNGHSPLALAITSGNDLAVEKLLSYGADPSLPLTHGVGSALCVASSTEHELRRSPEGRIKLIDRLISGGADILVPIPITNKRVAGTAVDYAYYMYNLDRRIAHMPYHALNAAERETFNARKQLLAHMGNILREKAVQREQQRYEEDRTLLAPSPNFVYTGAGAPPIPGPSKAYGRSSGSMKGLVKDGPDFRKPLLRYCYECGRSVGVRLSPCTRCKEVFYCSKACKLKAWNARHKEECVRVGGASPSTTRGGGGGGNRIDSPTPATDPDDGLPLDVKGMMANSRIKVPVKGRSTSAKTAADANKRGGGAGGGGEAAAGMGGRGRRKYNSTNTSNQHLNKGSNQSLYGKNSNKNNNSRFLPQIPGAKGASHRGGGGVTAIALLHGSKGSLIKATSIAGSHIMLDTYRNSNSEVSSVRENYSFV